jgi:hypothetical protein
MPDLFLDYSYWQTLTKTGYLAMKYLLKAGFRVIKLGTAGGYSEMVDGSSIEGIFEY